VNLDAVPTEFVTTEIEKSNVILGLLVHANTIFKQMLNLILRPLVLRWGLSIEYLLHLFNIKVTCAIVLFQWMAGMTVRNGAPIIFLNVSEICRTWTKLL
jgi:hypothetical protein